MGCNARTIRATSSQHRETKNAAMRKFVTVNLRGTPDGMKTVVGDDECPLGEEKSAPVVLREVCQAFRMHDVDRVVASSWPRLASGSSSWPFFLFRHDLFETDRGGRRSLIGRRETSGRAREIEHEKKVELYDNGHPRGYGKVRH